MSASHDSRCDNDRDSGGGRGRTGREGGGEGTANPSLRGRREIREKFGGARPKFRHFLRQRRGFFPLFFLSSVPLFFFFFPPFFLFFSSFFSPPPLPRPRGGAARAPPLSRPGAVTSRAASAPIGRFARRRRRKWAGLRPEWDFRWRRVVGGGRGRCRFRSRGRRGGKTREFRDAAAVTSRFGGDDVMIPTDPARAAPRGWNRTGSSRSETGRG